MAPSAATTTRKVVIIVSVTLMDPERQSGHPLHGFGSPSNQTVWP